MVAGTLQNYVLYGDSHGTLGDPMVDRYEGSSGEWHKSYPSSHDDRDDRVYHSEPVTSLVPFTIALIGALLCVGLALLVAALKSLSG